MRTFVCLALLGCAERTALPMIAPAPPLAQIEVERRIPAHVKDREGWAKDIVWALAENNIHVDVNSVCAVIAVVGQESGFSADPVVPNLGNIVRLQIDKVARAKLSVVGPWAVDKLLDRQMPHSRMTYAERLKHVHTERDVDLVFRALTAEIPVLNLERYNPITTAGAMQVSVRFSEEYADEHGQDDEGVRDALYTRDGGLYFGVARLFYYDARYDDMIYRFADYNAGVFASRNAAFQKQLSRLTKMSLAEDGDILAYDKRGDPTKERTKTLAALETLSPHARRDATSEKEEDFEMTDSWQIVKQTYRKRVGEPEYAIIPNVVLHSAKMSTARSTEWFARSVMTRYKACL